MIVSRRELILGGLAYPHAVAFEKAVAKASVPLKLHRGINTWPWFSLTTEYPPPRTDYAWPPFQAQRPVPSRLDLISLRTHGFDFIRMPIDPGPFLYFSGTRRSQLLQSVFEAVEEAVSAGLSVVVNIQPNEATHFWTSRRMIESVSAPSFGQYTDLVQDLAAGLERRAVERTILEPVNEPPQECDSAAWNNIQTSLLRSARAAAPQLSLVATGACGSMISGLQNLDPTPLLELGPILFTFHFYEPYVFSHQGAPWMREPIYRWLNGVPWPASAGSLNSTLLSVSKRMAQDTSYPAQDKTAVFEEIRRVLIEYFAAQPAKPFVDNYFTKVKDWAKRYRIQPEHIVVGEFGSLRSDSRYTASKAEDRVRYIRDVREAAEAAGFPWAFWNLFDGMGLVKDAERTFDANILDALGLKSK